MEPPVDATLGDLMAAQTAVSEAGIGRGQDGAAPCIGGEAAPELSDAVLRIHA